MSNQPKTVTLKNVWIEGLNIEDRKYTIDGQVYTHDELIDCLCCLSIDLKSFMIFGNLVPEGSNCAIRFDQLP